MSTDEMIVIIVLTNLKKAGIDVQTYDIDEPNKNFTVTTEQEVPEETMSSLSSFLEYQWGYTIEFLTV